MCGKCKYLKCIFDFVHKFAQMLYILNMCASLCENCCFHALCPLLFTVTSILFHPLRFTHRHPQRETQTHTHTNHMLATSEIPSAILPLRGSHQSKSIVFKCCPSARITAYVCYAACLHLLT